MEEQKSSPIQAPQSGQSSKISFALQQNYPFDVEDSQENIKYKILRADIHSYSLEYASLLKIIEWITHEKIASLDLRATFFYTYRMYATPEQVMKKLVERFCVPIPKNMSQSEKKQFQEIVEKKIKMKVLGVLRYWTESHFYDIAEDQKLRDSFYDFISNLYSLSKEEWLIATVNQIETITRTKFDELNKENARLLSLKKTISDLPTTGTIYKKFQKYSLFEFPCEEIAKQIGLLDFENFKKVRPKELLNRNWESEKASEKSPNILIITERTKKMSAWVAYNILQGKTEKEMQRRVIYFMDLLQKLDEMHDICGMIDIISGLKDINVKRLEEKIWNNIPPKRLEYLDKQFKALLLPTSLGLLTREIRLISPPCIPHIRLYCQEMYVFSEQYERKKHNLKFPNLISIPFCAKMADTLDFLRYFQVSGYSFKPNYELMKILINIPTITEEDLEALTYNITPKAIQ